MKEKEGGWRRLGGVEGEKGRWHGWTEEFDGVESKSGRGRQVEWREEGEEDGGEGQGKVKVK